MASNMAWGVLACYFNCLVFSGIGIDRILSLKQEWLYSTIKLENYLAPQPKTTSQPISNFQIIQKIFSPITFQDFFPQICPTSPHPPCCPALASPRFLSRFVSRASSTRPKVPSPRKSSTWLAVAVLGVGTVGKNGGGLMWHDMDCQMIREYLRRFYKGVDVGWLFGKMIF